MSWYPVFPDIWQIGVVSTAVCERYQPVGVPDKVLVERATHSRSRQRRTRLHHRATAVGFWLGSSSGSQKKDELISALAVSSGAAAPAVTSTSPKSGGVATAVTVTGSGFTGATSVRFGGNTATAMTVVSDAQIIATSPPGSGTVDITVVGPAGTSAISPAARFTYT